MRVIKTYLVEHENGLTEMYLLEDDRYILNVPTPTGNCWTNCPAVISERIAKAYIEAGA